jgi:hypothetical protein
VGLVDKFGSRTVAMTPTAATSEALVGWSRSSLHANTRQFWRSLDHIRQVNGFYFLRPVNRNGAQETITVNFAIKTNMNTSLLFTFYEYL